MVTRNEDRQVVCMENFKGGEGRVVNRVILPADIRHFLNIQAGDRLDIVVKQGEIRLSPSVDHCLLCHRADALIHIGKFAVCAPCVRRLATAEVGDYLYPEEP